VPIVQISSRSNIGGDDSQQAWWLQRLGEGNSYSGAVPGASRQSMEQLIDRAPPPMPPKSHTRSIPWLKTLGNTSSRRK
jgi:hypothetical protein